MLSGLLGRNDTFLEFVIGCGASLFIYCGEYIKIPYVFYIIIIIIVLNFLGDYFFLQSFFNSFFDFQFFVLGGLISQFVFRCYFYIVFIMGLVIFICFLSLGFFGVLQECFFCRFLFYMYNHLVNLVFLLFLWCFLFFIFCYIFIGFFWVFSQFLDYF